MRLLKPKDIKLKDSKPTVKNLDDMCRKMINLRDKSKCVRCGRAKPQYKTEWAHFYSRSNKAIRWDEDNSVILCFNCHYNFAHKLPREFTEWYSEYLGKDKLNKLQLRSHGKAGDLRLIKLYLEQGIKKYEAKI